MNFVYPSFLWALLLLALPIIIHLFNFRRYKTIYFSKVDLLNEAIEDSKSGNKLKHLLILMSRILTITALVFAFAQPFIASDEDTNTETVSAIYIDNSFSMQAQGQDGDLLNEVKNKAIDLVKSFEENEKINLITSELLSKDQRYYSKSEIIERIKNIGLSPASTNLTNVLNLQSDILSKSDEKQNKRLFLFSDFQKSTSDIDNIDSSQIQTFYYQAKAEVTGNVFVDSVWFETPVQSVNLPIEVHFKIQNKSAKALENLNIQLTINGKEKGIKTLKIEANSFIEDKISFSHHSPGIKQGEISIKTNQLFFDDHFYFTYTIQNQTNILIISPSESIAKPFEKLYEVNPFYNYTSININQLKQSDFNDKALIIFNGINNISSGSSNLLNEAISKGSSLVLIPGDKIDLKSWNSFLNRLNQPSFKPLNQSPTKLKYFNHSDPLFTGVFSKSPTNYAKTKIKKYYPLNYNSNQNFVSLFGINQNSPFLIYSKTKSGGRFFLQSSPLINEFNDFSKQALFAATFLRIAETSLYKKELFYTIGQNGNYSLLKAINENQPIHLINNDFKTDIIPQIINSNQHQKIVFDQLEGQLNQAGFYDLTNQTDFEDKIAFNFNRQESYTTCLSETDIANMFSEKQWSKTEKLALNEKGKIEIENIKPKEYWQLFLFLALLFLGIEIALIKLWKTK